MSDIPKIGVIGCGVMGSAIIKALLDNSIVSADQISVCDTKHDRLKAIHKEHGVEPTPNIEEVILQAEIIILAIKPQQADEVLEAMRDKCENNLIISIMAGTNVTKIAETSRCPNVVRAMPNTPASIGEGVSGWYATKFVSDKQKDYVQTILEAIGLAFEVPEEDMIDIVTAITGSGPAYIFYLAEHISETAVKMGVSKEGAKQMVEQLFTGSVHLWQQSKESPATLRKNVTSKGGTTEAALKVMDEKGMPEIIEQALRKAYDRAKELS